MLENWIQQIIMRTEIVLDHLLPSTFTEPYRLHSAMRYAVLDGGKRIRPLLCYATGALFDIPLNILDFAAAAIEMIHTYSLVHDDMPIMDNSKIRRGKPTVHIAYDEATALLVGDALQSQAFEIITCCPATTEQKIKLISELSHSIGSLGMVGGQYIDFTGITSVMNIRNNQKLSTLQNMYKMKTSMLFRTAVRFGIICSTKIPTYFELNLLDKYAENVGLAFQIIDDILDLSVTSEFLGKNTGKDRENNKQTYVTLLGMENAKKLVYKLHKNAKTALINFGNKANQLSLTTEYILKSIYY